MNEDDVSFIIGLKEDEALELLQMLDTSTYVLAHLKESDNQEQALDAGRRLTLQLAVAHRLKSALETA